MVRYLAAAPAEDAAWAVFFLTGQRLKRLISGRTLRAWAQQRTACPSGWSTKRTPRSATAPRRRRCWSQAQMPPSPRRSSRCRCTAGWRSASCRCRPAGRAPVCRGLRLVAGAAARAAACPEQAPDRRLSGRRREAPGGARARRGGRAAARDHRASPDGPAAAVRCLVSLPARRRERTDQARPYPFFLASPLEADAGDPRPARRLAGGMEVGRHSRPADAPRRRDLLVVTRRGADHRSLPRADPGSGTAAGRRRAGRRGAGLGRGRAAVRRAADAGSAATA